MGLLATLLCLAPPAALAGPQDGDRRSLEELLSEARARAAEVHARLADDVRAAVSELEALAGDRKGRDAEAIRRKLVAYGPPAAPVLAPFVEPGPAAPVAAVFRAGVVAGVLRELASPAITDDLLRHLRTGTPAARRNALVALEGCPEPGRVVPAVRMAVGSPDPAVRRAAVQTLGRLSGPEAFAALADALQDEDPEVVDAALASLGGVADDQVADRVAAFLAGLEAEQHLGGLRAFYGARRDLLDDPAHQGTLVELLARPSAPRAHAVGLLLLLTETGADLRTEARRALEPLGEHVSDELREAALVLLARSRDKGARRKFLGPYNDQVERQEDYDGVYTARGRAYYRLGEYQTAIKDYRQAIKLQNPRRPNPDHEPFFGLARCHARLGHFKEAADYLNSAPVSLARLRKLASDPAFAEMLESRYRTAFHLLE